MSARSECVRVKINFGDAFSASKLAFPLTWMHVDVSQITSIKQLCKSIKRRHALSGKYHLFLEDGILPPDEGIQILRDNDVIRVALASRTCNTSDNSFTEPRPHKRKRHDSNSISATEEHKHLCTRDVTSTPDASVRVKSKSSVSPLQEKPVSDDIPVEKHSGQSISLNTAKESRGSEEPLETTHGNNQGGTARRKRIRKHKKRKRSVNLTDAVVQPPVASFQQSTPVEPRTDGRHKFFDNTDEEDTRQRLPAAVPGSFGGPTQHLLPANDRANVVAQENDTSESEDEEVVPPLPLASTSSTSLQNTVAPEVKQVPINGTKEGRAPSYEKLPPVRVPRVGDHIAFKVLEMDEHYNPQESCYREGEVLSYNPKSGQISLHLQHPIPDPSIFVPVIEDGECIPLVDKVNYNWSHLLSPVLLEQEES